MNKAVVTRAFGAFALSVFICSVLYPFMRVQLLGIVTFTGAPGPTTFWSFKTNSIFYRTPDNPGPTIITELWFWDCWNQYTTYRTQELGLGINNVLISMLGAQVFTLLLTASAILKLKTHLHLSAAVVNVFTIFCMWLASRAFITSNYMYAFEAGFWLTLASATLFLAAAILSWKLLPSSSATQKETALGAEDAREIERHLSLSSFLIPRAYHEIVRASSILEFGQIEIPNVSSVFY